MKTAREIERALQEPFAADEVKWKPQTVKGDTALAVAYIDARAVMDRLDEVLGAANWQDEYATIEGHSVLCRLSLRIEGEWVTKCDVGGESEQPDEGDRMKAAHSDALKRAAVKWGIARYLYALPREWVDYDTKTKKLKAPTLPAWALPPVKPTPAPEADISLLRGELNTYAALARLKADDEVARLVAAVTAVRIKDGLVPPETLHDLTASECKQLAAKIVAKREAITTADQTPADAEIAPEPGDDEQAQDGPPDDAVIDAQGLKFVTERLFALQLSWAEAIPLIPAEAGVTSNTAAKALTWGQWKSVIAALDEHKAKRPASRKSK